MTDAGNSSSSSRRVAESLWSGVGLGFPQEGRASRPDHVIGWAVPVASWGSAIAWSALVKEWIYLLSTVMWGRRQKGVVAVIHSRSRLHGADGATLGSVVIALAAVGDQAPVAVML